MVIIIISRLVLVVNNPYFIALLFGQSLILITFVLGWYRKFIGFVIFIVYIGGIIILIRYCVMLFPSNKFDRPTYIPVLAGIAALIERNTLPVSSYPYGLLYSSRAVLLVGLLLYLVMLSIVEIINYSGGLLKM